MPGPPGSPRWRESPERSLTAAGLLAARARRAGLDTGGGPLVGSRFLRRGSAARSCSCVRAAPLLALLKDAVRPGGWYGDGGVVLDDRVYEGAGHVFSAAMVADAVEFVVRVAGGI